jgi:hypothetical protein
MATWRFVANVPFGIEAEKAAATTATTLLHSTPQHIKKTEKKSKSCPMADLAPSVGEQAALYVEIFSYAALGIVLIVLAMVLNWKGAAGLGMAVAQLLPQQVAGVDIGGTIRVVLKSWHGELRRVRRTITILFALSFLVSSYCTSNILTIAGTQLRADGVASQWQRWVGYTIGMVLTTAGLAQYYAIEVVATWVWVLVFAAAGMVQGVFVSLTAKGASGGLAKVINLSIWGPFCLLALIPIFYLYTTLDIWRKWWRGFPIIVHVAFAFSIWIILWAGPEVATDGAEGSRVGAAWGYLILVMLWYLIMVGLVYFWRIAPPRRRTYATDAVIMVNPQGVDDGANKGGKTTHKVVNLNPASPNYQPPGGSSGGGSDRLLPEAIRGRFKSPPARAGSKGHVAINFKNNSAPIHITTAAAQNQSSVRAPTVSHLSPLRSHPYQTQGSW